MDDSGSPQVTRPMRAPAVLLALDSTGAPQMCVCVCVSTAAIAMSGVRLPRAIVWLQQSPTAFCRHGSR